ncbi:hypothetical protein SISNIDRAFT_489393 [Sistotremastrum niveocremeum HHB9708]|uniref:Uncharacterized protein n=1 Tax=Sistotremastrum niveocremeum HHB9708 TaxID=1314777 RepID=A0A164PZ72_9AGAM|nr:hypothetical protein SISNIDRAFT_489393 [Sistotremastrum niveocremeum HHB9708]
MTEPILRPPLTKTLRTLRISNTAEIPDTAPQFIRFSVDFTRQRPIFGDNAFDPVKMQRGADPALCIPSAPSVSLSPAPMNGTHLTERSDSEDNTHPTPEIQPIADPEANDEEPNGWGGSQHSWGSRPPLDDDETSWPDTNRGAALIEQLTWSPQSPQGLRDLASGMSTRIRELLADSFNDVERILRLFERTPMVLAGDPADNFVHWRRFLDRVGWVSNVPPTLPIFARRRHFKVIGRELRSQGWTRVMEWAVSPAAHITHENAFRFLSQGRCSAVWVYENDRAESPQVIALADMSEIRSSRPMLMFRRCCEMTVLTLFWQQNDRWNYDPPESVRRDFRTHRMHGQDGSSLGDGIVDVRVIVLESESTSVAELTQLSRDV